MGDESPQNRMNLDLNLEPDVHPSQDDQPSFEDWLDGSMREFEAHRLPSTARQRSRSVYRPSSLQRAINMAIIAANQRSTNDDVQTYNNDGKNLENGDVEKSKGDESSFFDCNICLDLASDPVVTCCGHLFCWPCIYRWLYVHSEAKECPICKGEVTIKSLTPIYSRGNNTQPTKLDSRAKIPSRPQANRVESWRQSFQRNAINLPMFEMIRRLDNRFDLTRDTITQNPQEIPTSSLMNRIFTSRGMRRVRDTHTTAFGAVEPNHPVVNPEPGSSSNQALTIPRLSSSESFAEMYVDDGNEEHENEHEHEHEHEHPPLMEDRHSMSSIAAIIQTGSQTADTAAETDSRVSVSTSRRRRGCESSTSRVSDESMDSRTRRRRLQ